MGNLFEKVTISICYKFPYGFFLSYFYFLCLSLSSENIFLRTILLLFLYFIS